MSNIWEQYSNVAGVQVAVKTNLGPELVVYDADAPENESALANLLQVGVIMRDRRGRRIAGTNTWPATNPLLAGAALAGIGAVVFLIARGLAK